MFLFYYFKAVFIKASRFWVAQPSDVNRLVIGAQPVQMLTGNMENTCNDRCLLDLHLYKHISCVLRKHVMFNNRLYIAYLIIFYQKFSFPTMLSG